MPKLVWDQSGDRLYETGTDKGVLFVKDEVGAYGAGVPWNGLVSVKDANDGAEETPLYANNRKYLSLMSAENKKGSIDAYTYPEEFESCDGSKAVNPGVYVGQQIRKEFGLAYSTIVGNDTQGNAYGEKIHIIYNAKVAPAARDFETVNADPAALTFSWNYTTTPVDLSDIGLEASAGIIIEKSKVSASAWTTLQEALYGNDKEGVSHLPTIQEVITMTVPTTTTTTA